MRLYMLVDPLITTHGSVTPAILLGKRLNGEVEIVSPIISEEVQEYLSSEGLFSNSINRHYRYDGSLLTLESWFRPIEFKNSRDESIVINFSQCFENDADIYYAPGPITFALDDIYPVMRRRYKIIYNLLRSFITWRDRRFNERLRKRTRLFISVSNYTATLYRRWGIRVESVLYPPLDLNRFRPSTHKPDEDYILSYIGKETRFDILDRIARKGVRIKGFGSKMRDIPSYIKCNPNIELLGSVSDDELVELYSNALYTLFPFTHEPFGYIPIESMACSTPVLTYNRQGPSETVTRDTGWLMDDDDSIIELAVRLWKNGYDKSIRSRCRERVSIFDADNISKEWKVLINNIIYAR